MSPLIVGSTICGPSQNQITLREVSVTKRNVKLFFEVSQSHYIKIIKPGMVWSFLRIIKICRNVPFLHKLVQFGLCICKGPISMKVRICINLVCLKLGNNEEIKPSLSVSHILLNSIIKILGVKTFYFSYSCLIFYL